MHEEVSHADDASVQCARRYVLCVRKRNGLPTDENRSSLVPKNNALSKRTNENLNDLLIFFCAKFRLIFIMQKMHYELLTLTRQSYWFKFVALATIRKISILNYFKSNTRRLFEILKNGFVKVIRSP